MTDVTSNEWPPWRIGIIDARHQMPVEEYLVASVNPGQSAYDAVYEALDAWLEAHPGVATSPERPLQLYFSGLTEATLAATDVLHNRGCQHAHLMRYDRVQEDYEVLQRRIRPCSVRPAEI